MPAYQELRNNQNEKSAVFVTSANASGGYKAGWLGSRPDNDIQWNDVYVCKSGTYRMTVTFFSGEDRQMDLTVNGQPVTTLMTHSRNWTAPARVSLDVYLKKGRNSIRLSNASDWMPDIDVMTIE